MVVGKDPSRVHPAGDNVEALDPATDDLAAKLNPKGKEITLIETKKRKLSAREAKELQTQYTMLKFLDSKPLQFFLGVGLMFALFGVDLVEIFRLPDSFDSVLSAILTLVLFTFSAEIIILSIAKKDYFLSFFFFMDILGTASVCIDIPWITGDLFGSDLTGSSQSTEVMKASKASKIGARSVRIIRILRVVRLVRLFKIYKYLNIFNRTDEFDDEAETANDKLNRQTSSIANKLSELVARRVSALVMVSIFCGPLLMYSSTDYSKQIGVHAFSNAIESHPIYTNDSMASADKELALEDFAIHFVNEYLILGEDTPINITVFRKTDSIEESISWDFTEADATERYPQQMLPVRSSNIMFYISESGNALAFFSVEDTAWNAAVFNVLLVLFVLLLLLSFAGSLTISCKQLIVDPLNRLLKQINGVAVNSGINSKSDGDGPVEIEALENLVSKLGAVLESKSSDQNKVSVQNVLNSSSLDANTRDWIASNFTSINSSSTSEKPPSRLVRMSSTVSAIKHRVKASTRLDRNKKNSSADKNQVPSIEESTTSEVSSEVEETEIVYNAIKTIKGLNRTMFDRWDYDCLVMDSETRQAHALFLLTEMARITEYNIEKPTLSNFIVKLDSKYNDNQFHSFAHGLDVMHLTYRFLTVTDAVHWLMPYEMITLMFAALAHDAGHQGLNNNFLVNTGHELALTYNDKSPLENMHASLCYQVINTEGCNVFDCFSTGEAKEVRKIVIETILATDMSDHFAMISRLNLMREMYPTCIDTNAATTARDLCPLGVEGAQNHRRLKYFMGDEKNKGGQRLLNLQLFIHAADINNPMKSAESSKRWVDLLMEEFFSQGDRERELGLPVSSLCDRHGTVVSQSQFNFISFVAAPLYQELIKIFPSCSAISGKIIINQRFWLDEFKQMTDPAPEQTVLKKMEIQHQSLSEQLNGAASFYSKYKTNGGSSSAYEKKPTNHASTKYVAPVK